MSCLHAARARRLACLASPRCSRCRSCRCPQTTAAPQTSWCVRARAREAGDWWGGACRIWPTTGCPTAIASGPDIGACCATAHVRACLRLQAQEVLTDRVAYATDLSVSGCLQAIAGGCARGALCSCVDLGAHVNHARIAHHRPLVPMCCRCRCRCRRLWLPGARHLQQRRPGQDQGPRGRVHHLRSNAQRSHHRVQVCAAGGGCVWAWGVHSLLLLRRCCSARP